MDHFFKLNKDKVFKPNWHNMPLYNSTFDDAKLEYSGNPVLLYKNKHLYLVRWSRTRKDWIGNYNSHLQTGFDSWTIPPKIESAQSDLVSASLLIQQNKLSSLAVFIAFDKGWSQAIYSESDGTWTDLFGKTYSENPDQQKGWIIQVPTEQIVLSKNDITGHIDPIWR